MITTPQVSSFVNSLFMRFFAGLSKGFGRVLYGIFTPVVRLVFNHWKHPYFVLACSCSTFFIFVILYFTGWDYYIFAFSLTDTMTHTYDILAHNLTLWMIDHSPIPGMLPIIVARFLLVILFKIIPLILVGSFIFGIFWAIFRVHKEKRQEQQQLIRDGRAF